MNRIRQALREHPVAWLTALCLLVIAVLVVRNLVAPREDAQLATIRKAGYPVTLSELNAYYAAAPENQNAALVYQKAFQLDLFTNSIFEGLAGKDPGLKRGERLPVETGEELAAALATNAAAWQLVYSATNFLASRYPLDMRDGFMVLLPHLARIKRAVTLLSLEGFSHASRGENNQAYAAFNAALRAGDSLREEPILISFLVRVACSTIVAKQLERSLNLVQLQEAQLDALQQEFAAAESQRGAARALAGERAFGLSFFIDRHIQRSIVPQQGTALPSGLVGQIAVAAYRASGLMAKDRKFYLDAMGKSIALAELPAEERIKAGPSPSMMTSNRFLVISRTMLPALARTLDRANEYSARMRVVETALGVERFRLAHAGALPEKLDELTPRFVPAVRVDPFDSKPLRYKRLPHGYVVYSVGPDQHDDGGAEPPATGNSGTRSKTTPTDITFVVERE